MMHRPRLERRVARILLLVVALAASAIDAGAADREHQQLMADLRMLQEQTQQLQVAMNALAEALKVVTTRIDDQGNTARKAFADQRLLIETLGGDVRIVREKVDETNVRIASLSQEVEAMRGVVTALATPPPPPAVVPPEENPVTDPDLPAPAVTPAPVAPPSITGLSPQRMYDSAFADYASGQWSLAILGFEQYLKAFPRSEQADQAQYYIGESYLPDNKLDQAIAAYDKVITNYPTGDYAHMAYYRKGLVLEKLKQYDRARETWQTVVQKYPDSEGGRLAKQGLDRLARPNR
jgi:tol-pal system protein YbgF